jgi:hypothetical protein
MIVMGYKAYKEAVAPYSKDKFLTLSGKMLRNLNVLTAADNSVIVGFSDPELAQRAYWLNVSGAGRGRKLWKFLGIRKQQEVELAAEFSGRITSELFAFFDKIRFTDTLSGAHS